MICTTSSIRKKCVLLAACMATMVGCTYRHNSPPVENVAPIPADEAMQHRDWPQVAAVYPKGAVVAGPTNFNYEPKRGMPEWNYYYADTSTFTVNMLLLPYNFFKAPPWTARTYPGETIPPTFTAQPVMPPAGMVQPGTTPVIENPGAQPSTPTVVEPGAMPPPGSDTNPQATPPAPSPSETTPVPAPTPAPETGPAPQATPAPAPQTAPAPSPQATPAPAPAPQATPEPAPAPGEVAPATPRVIEAPPPEATRNLAPPMPKPTTGPVLNKD
jgi:hypothetical protein